MPTRPKLKNTVAKRRTDTSPGKYVPFKGSNAKYVNKRTYLNMWDTFKKIPDGLSSAQKRHNWLVKHGIPKDKALKLAKDPEEFKKLTGLD